MSSSPSASAAQQLVNEQQSMFVSGLESLGSEFTGGEAFEWVEWLRDGGVHGGGNRYCSGGDEVFNRAAVNVSHIHYGDLPDKALASATALSTIIHPKNPHAPSVHMHISWTEMKDGKGYWRIMADLNPSITYDEDKESFEKVLRGVAGELYAEASQQGDKYFYIPVLGRHRGVAHFYLEGYHSGHFDEDAKLASLIGKSVINEYLRILANALHTRTEVSEEARSEQLAYHTLYLFQVLTLDRGTTSGLLVHDQNDLGIMGSLPAQIDRGLLASWRDRMESPQEELLERLVGCLPESGVVDDDARLNLAQAVREHYRSYPDALRMQASGNMIPPTVQNHR